ncbi:MAG: UvrD-helicase domain-containing protein [Gemmatimonadota bacterium]
MSNRQQELQEERPAAPKYLDNLNPEQREAVEHFEGPLLVLAGAGSGKTRVLTARIAHLIRHHGVPSDRILAVTFTNKAAGEMRERIAGMLGGEPRGIWMGTFHALGARLLRRHAAQLGWTHAFTIFDADQSLKQIRKSSEALDIDPKRWKPKALRAVLGDAKNQLVTPQEFLEQHGEGFDLFARMAAQLYPTYQDALRAQNAFDFDDLLVKPVELLESDPALLERYRDRFAFILVDEYQDTNRAQFRFLELLAGGRRNIMVVGDEDQSIYGWRGADIRNILDFERTYPGSEVVRLERNYRSTEVILNAANSVIRLNVQRKGKTLRTERTGGEPLTLVETVDESDEANWIVQEIEARSGERPGSVYRDFAILYRTNAQSRALEDAFRRRGVPYQIVGGVRFYERREIQDVLAYLRLISNPLDEGAFDRAVNYPRRGIGKASHERLAAWAKGEGIPLIEAALRADEAPDVPTGGARQLKVFAELVQRYSSLATRMSVGELLEELVEELDLLRHLREEGPDGDDRAENVKELIAGAHEFVAEVEEELDDEDPDRFTELDHFLQQVALVADIDRHDPASDAVTMMTLHNAKGLEYPVVFVAGMEDGLFPLMRSLDDPDQLEEERRLFYVGLTRPQDKLYLTHARERRRAGDFTQNRVSSFVESIPEELIEARKSPRLQRERSFEVRPRGERSGGFGAGLERRRAAGDTPGGGATGRGGAGQGESGPPETPFDDEGFNQDRPRFIKGERVLHATFGSGTVVEVTGFGRELKVTVDFQSVGRKKLLVRYANLERDY